MSDPSFPVDMRHRTPEDIEGSAVEISDATGKLHAVMTNTKPILAQEWD
eukprot:SAG31_NODE_41611_length_275_cov_0.670455_1_plen_48_part_01